MDLIKCPECGEMYSASYPRCPFCEEDGDSSRKIKYKPRRRIANKQKAQSARGGIIAVLVLVLALMSFYLFGDKFLHPGETPVEPSEVTEPAIPASNTTDNSGKESDDPFFDPNSGASENGGSDVPDVPAVPETPVEDENVDVSNAKLNREDFTLSGVGDSWTLKLSGTEATPHWSIDNGNIASIDGNGKVTAIANGKTTIHCKVGSRDLTCTLYVRNTGKTAAAADAPTTAEPITPVAPAAPGTSTTPAPATPSTPSEPSTPSTPSTPAATPTHVDASSLKLRTNLTGVLPKDGDTKTYDCTVSIGGDVIRLIVVDENGKEVQATWKSADPSVATISDNGTVTPQEHGKKTTMTATVGDATVNCIIRVR